MASVRMIVLALLLVFGVSVGRAAAPGVSEVKWHPGHYVFVAHQPIRPEHIQEHFRGVQRCYAWNILEPEQGRYDFATIRADLALLKQHGKRLVVQVQYKAFGKDQCYVPAYIRGLGYGGGIYRANSGSLNPVIWNARVGERMDALFAALGRELDAEASLEAVTLPETSLSADLVRAPQVGVEPYTPAVYLEALKQRMAALRKAMPHTVVIQYANFPQNLLPSLTEYMKEIGVGMGGPDVYPRPSALSDPERGVYRLYPRLAGVVPLGAAVQGPDYSLANWKRTAAANRGQDRDSVQLDPGDEDPIPVREHLELARKLRLNCLFYGSFFALMPAAAADFYGLKNMGVNYGLIFTGFGVAGVVGSLLGSRVKDILGSYDVAYWVFVGMLVVSAILAFFTRAPKLKNEEPAAEPATAGAK